MNNISKLFKIRFFIIILGIIFALSFFWKDNSNLIKIDFDLSMLPTPNYQQINPSLGNFREEMGKNITDDSLENSSETSKNYLIFSDLYSKRSILTKFTKKNKGWELFKKDINNETFYFIKSHRLQTEEDLLRIQNLLQEASISYKQISVVGNISAEEH